MPKERSLSAEVQEWCDTAHTFPSREVLGAWRERILRLEQSQGDLRRENAGLRHSAAHLDAARVRIRELEGGEAEAVAASAYRANDGVPDFRPVSEQVAALWPEQVKLIAQAVRNERLAEDSRRECVRLRAGRDAAQVRADKAEKQRDTAREITQDVITERGEALRRTRALESERASLCEAYEDGDEAKGKLLRKAARELKEALARVAELEGVRDDLRKELGELRVEHSRLQRSRRLTVGRVRELEAEKTAAWVAEGGEEDALAEDDALLDLADLLEEIISTVTTLIKLHPAETPEEKAALAIGHAYPLTEEAHDAEGADHA